jgi:hypothetical protein
MEQRYVPLKFTPGTGMVRATIPPSADVAPPGYYMLFIINSAGVPSVATMVQLDPTVIPPPPPSPPTLTGTSPGSPANDNHPEVKGTLGSGGATLVSIYANRTCTGKPAAMASSSAFTGSGITISVPDDSSTPISATAGNAGGDSGCSNSISYVESSSPPNTTITSASPALTNRTTATFGFAASEGGSTFACRFDDAADFTPCSSPKTYTGLAEGAHLFRVRATDVAGNTDPTPATRWVTVDTTPPDTTIDSGPSGTITGTTATFEFSSEPGAHFQCRMDNSAFAACSSPRTYSGLAAGTHTFRVRAIDGAGNPDPTPATRTFTVVP